VRRIAASYKIKSCLWKPRVKTASKLKDWLEGIGLGLYGELFTRHRIDLDVVSDLTESDLAELGLPLGDRRRLQRAISSLADAGSAEAPPRMVVGAERRQLTVMFCDMVGSTSLSEQFDPEDVRDVIAAYRETCVSVVESYEGFVARYIGDGILVYFGYPAAHEDDAERAVRAGLDIVQSISKSTEAHGILTDAPAVRIGIATGLVVVGDLIGKGTEEHDSAVGETPNVAARLQALAPPNGVVIAASTQSLLQAKFDYQDLGGHALKGLSEPVRAWLVIRTSRIESRFAATIGSRLTPLVNRDAEIALLLTRWHEAKERDGQVVLLSGEPGIGKSRIVQELRERIAGEAHGRISFQCSPYCTSTPLYPFVEQLKFVVGVDREAPSTMSLARLEASIAATTGEPARVTPLLAALLSIPTDDQYDPLTLSPQQQKDATVAALADRLIGLARDEPLLIIFEDTHWIDPTSQEVLDLLVDRVENTSILVIITCRSEYQPRWHAHSHLTTLTLNRLSRQLRTTLVERVAGAAKLPKDVIDAIIVKTDGVPLFLEELTKAVIESNLLRQNDGRYVVSGPLHQLAIPTTLTDSLMARLDRLGPFKKIAQVGATIGREFSYEILCAVAEATAEELNAALTRLEAAGLIVCRGHVPDSVYSFKHVMIQNAAHSSLLHSDKKRLHSKIALVLSEKYPERAAREPELLAHHFTESDQPEAAVQFWLKAGKQAAKSGANLEAIGHLRRGLEVVQGNPKMPGRDEVELELRIGLGAALIAGKGYAVQEVEENYSRALKLGQHIDDEQTIFTATRGLWVCNFIRADLARAHVLSVDLLNLAERKHPNKTADQASQATGYLIEAHRAMAQTLLYEGRFEDSQDHIERGIRLYDPNLHGPLTEKHAIDPGIVLLSYLGYLQWFLGHPDKARQHINQAISKAEEKRHPFTLAFAWEFGAYLCQHLRDVEGTRDHADRALAISSEHGFLHWKHQATILRGWSLAELGHIDEGLNQLRAGLEGYEAMDSWLASCWFRSLLANAYVGAGQPDAAFRALDDAITIAKRTGDQFSLAEIYRLQGEITFAQGGPTADAEDYYYRAMEVARNQKALSWELRTSVSLARLWRAGGKHQQASDLLLPIASKLTEGFSTRDVREAVELMNELTGPRKLE
jgi:class 3 adenylate cyclase/predicted ATPase